ncbi:formylmethanofuran--tetrahydromethanopterin N-formyltransferase [Planctomicrobium sp. SH664]|uniref:formylmethanofuran--tetrahydromethanopterin N-formyltransferase n=1 Tax=Planctomicrobium sp. SH664 TaxID=3448125 RepID=UPI003F5B1244
MPTLKGVDIVDTFAEAFPIKGARLIITAAQLRWAVTAATVFCGNATSVIACDIEAAIERELTPQETPDGRPGVSVLAFGFDRDRLESALQRRVGQCILTCPTTACFNGIDECPRDKQISIGGAVRFFGDGFQTSKLLAGKRYWRIPVMDGEFVCEDRFGTVTAIAGGNLLLCGRDAERTLLATEAAVTAMRQVRDIALPFPGGIVRSGSKVGSKYSKLRASTNDAYCPTLRPLTTSALPPECGAVYEIVIDGLTFEAIQTAMRAGLQAAVDYPGILQITAGNYGGKLGKHHFHLRELL